ncbi:TetR/AcrR family transcriptional regulator [Acidaminobacterium chupaoyuni]
MPRQGLNQESVVEASIRLIEEKGYAAFSMGELAKSLNIKTASLYNHVESLDSLFTEVGLAAVSQMVVSETRAIEGKTKNEALFAIADAYRAFAKEHNELYRVIMSLQKSKNKVLEQAAGQITQPILQVLSGYGLDTTAQMHWQRILRSMMHGFVAHEAAGGFSHFPIDKNESYQMAIQCVADGLQNAGREQHEHR